MEKERKLVPPERRDNLPLIRSRKEGEMSRTSRDSCMGGRPDIYVTFYMGHEIAAQKYMTLDMNKVFSQVSQKAAELFPGTKWALYSGNAQYRYFKFTADDVMWHSLKYGTYFDIRYLEVCLEPDVNKYNVTSDEQNVKCDNCYTWITGHRFKCLECSDFDICASCEGRSVHAEHSMLRIVGPGKTHIPEWVKEEIRI